ncbi:MAG: dual specificity protein phosphatase family protein [Actinomycetia bacterium]|nr:dual specificity protein phosphatase family protein [Actinomycetes bacterium]
MDRLTERVFLGDSGDGPAMIEAGATRLVDLRAETRPPRYRVPVDHFPLEDLVEGQEEIIWRAARRVQELVAAGETVGVYCQAGVSRTAAVAIAYLMLEGMDLPTATGFLRSRRPAALPALGLWKSLEVLARRRWEDVKEAPSEEVR